MYYILYSEIMIITQWIFCGCLWILCKPRHPKPCTCTYMYSDIMANSRLLPWTTAHVSNVVYGPFVGLLPLKYLYYWQLWFIGILIVFIAFNRAYCLHWMNSFLNNTETSICLLKSPQALLCFFKEKKDSEHLYNANCVCDKAISF